MLIPGVILLSTPGHSPGHLSLLIRLPETGAVILAGDAISRQTELEEGLAVNSWDKDVARASAEKLVTIAKREEAMLIYRHDPQQWKTLRKAPAFYA